MVNLHNPTVHIDIEIERKPNRNAGQSSSSRKQKLYYSRHSQTDLHVNINNGASTSEQTKKTALSETQNSDCKNVSLLQPKNIDIQIVKCLKALFETCDTKSLVRNIISAVNKPYSPELELLMGEEFPEFLNLTRKEKVELLCRRLNKLQKYSIQLVREENYEWMKQNEEDPNLQKELESKILAYFDNVRIMNNDATRNDTNSSAISIRTSRVDQRKFQNVMSFWKTIESGDIKLQLIEPTGDPGTSNILVDGPFQQDPIAGGEPYTQQISVFDKPLPLLCSWRILLLLVLVIVILGVCLLYFGIWPWSNKTLAPQCYLCDSTLFFLLNKALEFLI